MFKDPYRGHTLDLPVLHQTSDGERKAWNVTHGLINFLCTGSFSVRTSSLLFWLYVLVQHLILIFLDVCLCCSCFSYPWSCHQQWCHSLQHPHSRARCLWTPCYWMSWSSHLPLATNIPSPSVRPRTLTTLSSHLLSSLSCLSPKLHFHSRSMSTITTALCLMAWTGLPMRKHSVLPLPCSVVCVCQT